MAGLRSLKHEFQGSASTPGEKRVRPDANRCPCPAGSFLTDCVQTMCPTLFKKYTTAIGFGGFSAIDIQFGSHA